MTSLNNIINDTSYRKIEPEVLIELPDPKPITDNCTIIMNGHHNFGMSEEKESRVNEEPEMDKKHLNHFDTKPTTKNNNSIEHSNSDMFPLKESFAASSEESDGGAEEPESSTLLLQEQTELSPKCSKNKAKLPSFKPSPSRKQSSQDPHSHVQHRPLGHPQETNSDDIFIETKPSKLFNRLCLIVLTWSFLVCVSVSVFFVVYFTYWPSCDETTDWWQESSMYEVFPASFQDTDGDGFGDMKGLLDRLDYIQNLSVDVVRLNSIFSALDYPLEYEHVIDFANVDPHLGRMEDFQEVVREIHGRGMRVILDMNPTVTSDQHSWAAHWLLHRPGPFHYFYINQTDKEGEEPPLEPNPDYTNRNWTPPHRTFGSHLFLNWSNPLLQLEMAGIIEMWTAQGIDGFYMKHVKHLHVADSNQLAVLFKQWRTILDKYGKNATRKVLMVSHQDMEYLQRVMDPVIFLEMPGLVDLVDAGVSPTRNKNISVSTLVNGVEDIIKFWKQFPSPPLIVWHMGSVETMRLSNRIGEHNMPSALHYLALLPGSYSTFYGDEIGMMDSYDPDTLEVFRGGQLAPMQWTPGPQANFTTEDTPSWLPVNPNYISKNVESISQTDRLRIFAELKKSTQAPDKDANSPYRYFASPTDFFNTVRPRQADVQWYNETLGLIIARFCENILVANFGNQPVYLGDIKCVEVAPFLNKRFQDCFTVFGSKQNSVEFHKIRLQASDAVCGPQIQF